MYNYTHNNFFTDIHYYTTYIYLPIFLIRQCWIAKIVWNTYSKNFGTKHNDRKVAKIIKAKEENKIPKGDRQ